MHNRNSRPAPPNTYWRGDTLWYRFVVQGRELRGSLQTSDTRLAAKRVGEMIDAAKSSRFEKRRVPWQEAAGRYLVEEAPRVLKPASLRRYSDSWKFVGSIEVATPFGRRQFDSLFMDEITPAVLRQIVIERRKAGVTNGTINRDITSISAVLRSCVANGDLDANPAQHFDRAAVNKERRHIIRLPSWVSVARAIQQANDRLGPLLHVLYPTGMRLEEAADLDRARLHLKRSEIGLLNTKTSMPRVVPLRPAAVETLAAVVGEPAAAQVVRLRAPAKVFLSANGERFAKGGLPGNLARAVKKAGGTFRIHDLRHLFAVDWLREARGKEHRQGIYELQQILGHSSVTMTERYLAYVGTGTDHEDSWPGAKPLYEMSYAEVMALDLSKFGVAHVSAHPAAQVQAPQPTENHSVL